MEMDKSKPRQLTNGVSLSNKVNKHEELPAKDRTVQKRPENEMAERGKGRDIANCDFSIN